MKTKFTLDTVRKVYTALTVTEIESGYLRTILTSPLIETETDLFNFYLSLVDGLLYPEELAAGDVFKMKNRFYSKMDFALKYKGYNLEFNENTCKITNIHGFTVTINTEPHAWENAYEITTDLIDRWLNDTK